MHFNYTTKWQYSFHFIFQTKKIVSMQIFVPSTFSYHTKQNKKCNDIPNKQQFFCSFAQTKSTEHKSKWIFPCHACNKKAAAKNKTPTLWLDISSQILVCLSVKYSSNTTTTGSSNERKINGKIVKFFFFFIIFPIFVAAFSIWLLVVTFYRREFEAKTTKKKHKNRWFENGSIVQFIVLPKFFFFFLSIFREIIVIQRLGFVIVSASFHFYRCLCMRKICFCCYERNDTDKTAIDSKEWWTLKWKKTNK